jgi:hypothetical protein
MLGVTPPDDPIIKAPPDGTPRPGDPSRVITPESETRFRLDELALLLLAMLLAVAPPKRLANPRFANGDGRAARLFVIALDMFVEFCRGLDFCKPSKSMLPRGRGVPIVLSPPGLFTTPLGFKTDFRMTGFS